MEMAEMIPLWALWWVWMAAALLLAMVEIMLPGFLFLGFAIGAAFVGLVLIAAPLMLGLPLLLVLFAVLSLIAWAVLRRLFSFSNGQVRRVHDDVNDG
jgi:membrane protein implicated in regulation of membrane protease activity